MEVVDDLPPIDAADGLGALSRSIKRAIAVLLLLAAVSTAFWGISCYKAYLDSKESVISQELIVIE